MERRVIPIRLRLPSVPEIRTLLMRLLLRPPTRRRFVIAWSNWRRQHQIAAAQAHYAAREMQL